MELNAFVENKINYSGNMIVLGKDKEAIVLQSGRNPT